MGDNASNLEEYMYWSHFKTVQFCHILSGRFHQHLAIPEKFAKNLIEKLAGTVVLRGPSGCTWDVDLTANGHTLLLKGGWKKFVEDHSLEENDILFFKYNGSSKFDVLIFDKESFCEKESSYFVKKRADFAGSGGGRRGCMKRGKVEAASEETNDESSGYIAEYPEVKRRTRAAAPAMRTSPSARLRAPATARGRGRKRSVKVEQGSTCMALVQRKPLGRVIGGEGKERAYQMAVEASSDSSFIAVMNASNVYKGFYLSIPCEWTRKFLRPNGQVVELRIDHKTWPATARCYSSRKRSYQCIGQGWRKFVTDNSLQQFDVCLFTLVSASQDLCILDVKIFRVKENVQPAPSTDHPRTPNVSTMNEGEDA